MPPDPEPALDSLLVQIRDEIAAGGPLTFAAYMTRALYHPAHGYYTSRVPGDGVDYATSASIGHWFGRYVARELERMWMALGEPDPFTVIEFGAGLGRLAAGAIASAGRMRPVLQWRIIEQFDSIAALQRQTLGPDAGLVTWASTLQGAAPVTGCVLGNEVLDNFPVHLFQMAQGQAREVYVTWEAGRLVEQLGPPSSAGLLDGLGESLGGLNDGDRFEVCPGVGGWCRQAAEALDRGYLLTIDYGDEEPDILRRGPKGTIATYAPARLGPDPLEDPGRKDITADVNFTALTRHAAAAGFDFELLTLQRYWLLSLGIDAHGDELEAEEQIARAFGMADDAELLATAQRELQALADGEGLGGCLVFRASKGFTTA